MKDQTYYSLGNSSLTVSQLAFGVMTFGSYEGVGTSDWGASEKESRRMFDTYLDWGGNMFDTAPSYTFGESEKMLGRFVKASGARDKVVISTKFSHPASAEGPNGGGACRNSVIRSVEHSLQRLDMDYIDLLFLHAWDRRTSPAELAATLNDLVRAGKVRYIGLSNMPAWYVARMQTVAEWRGLEPICALQFEYSLVNRDIENEYVPLCIDAGMSITGFGSIAAGFLTGKYVRAKDGDSFASGEGRLASMKDIPTPQVQRFTQRNWKILEEVEFVANELGRSIAQVAINWVVNRPAVGTTILGASKQAQLESNLQALDFEIPTDLAQRLTAASETPAMQLPTPYSVIDRETSRHGLHGGLNIMEKPPNYYDVSENLSGHAHGNVMEMYSNSD